MKINIYNTKAEVVGSHELAPSVFAVVINASLVHQAVVAQQANERQVLAHTKTRSEVRGGGKKPWKQKGTGRARAGSSRSPIWIGGGVTFGPTKDRNFSKKINAQMKKKALTMVLTDKVNHSALLVLENFNLPQAKTKAARELLTTLTAPPATTEDITPKASKRSVVVIIESTDEAARRALRNLEDVSVVNIQNINIVDLLKRQAVVTTKACIDHLEHVYTAK